MRTPRFFLPFYLSLLLSLALLIAGCGGGGDTTGPSQDLRSLQDALAESEAEQRRIAAALAEAERRRQQAEAEQQRLQDEANQPTPEPETEEETPNPYNIPSEWVWHEGRFIPLEDVPVVVPEPEPLASEVYLSWGYHASPSLTDFGPWADTLPQALVELSHATFGVVQHGGKYVAWMKDTLPDTSLYVNDEVRRTYDEYGYWTTEYSDLRWRGTLVGYTPSGQFVSGDATLSDFDFSGTRHRGGGWDPGKAYLAFTNLAYDNGSVWGDGDLEYEVGLGSTFAGGPNLHNSSFSHPFNKFDCTKHSAGCHADSLRMAAGVRASGYSTNDAGEVRGILFGPQHEAMAGTLERDDLTAAFGGER